MADPLRPEVVGPALLVAPTSPTRADVPDGDRERLGEGRRARSAVNPWSSTTITSAPRSEGQELGAGVVGVVVAHTLHPSQSARPTRSSPRTPDRPRRDGSRGSSPRRAPDRGAAPRRLPTTDRRGRVLGGDDCTAADGVEPARWINATGTPGRRERPTHAAGTWSTGCTTERTRDRCKASPSSTTAFVVEIELEEMHARRFGRDRSSTALVRTT